MDLRICGFASLIETVGLLGLRHVDLHLAWTFLSIWTVQYTMMKIYRIFIYPTWFAPLRYLPGPKNGHPFFGQTIRQFTASSPIDLYVAWSRRWPDAPFVRYLEIGGREVLLVNTLEAHREVLHTHCYSTIKPHFIARLICEIAGFGVFAAEGEAHKRQRRLLAGPFSKSNLKKILPVFKIKAEELVRHVEEQRRASDADTVEMQAVFTRATLDVIGKTVLGVELNNLSASSTTMDFRQCYDRMFNQSPLSGLITFINVIVPVRRWLPIEANLDFVRASEAVRSMLTGAIRERVRMLGGGGDFQEQKSGSETGFSDKTESRGEFVGSDILTYMIEERLVGEDAWTEDDILEQLLNFMSAGSETSATTLTWAIHKLALMPDVQAKLRVEIADLLARKPDPDFSDIEGLHYLHNFIREVLRLCSPTVLCHRETTEDLNIAGVPIPRGTALFICPAVMNRSPEIWGPTADEFCPERWDDLRGDAASPYAFEPFINGPRGCIGRQFALLEMKVMLVALASRFRFVPSPEQHLGKVEVMNPSLTYRPKSGMRVSVEML